MKPASKLRPPMLVLPLAGTLLVTGLALGAWNDKSGSWVSAAILVTAAAAATAVPWMFALRELRRARDAQRYLELLCQRDEAEEAGLRSLDLPTLEEKSPWTELLRHLLSRTDTAAERLAATEHARAALELRYRRNLARSERVVQVINGMSEPVIAVDRYDELLLANPSAEKLLGLDRNSPAQRVQAQLDRCERLVNLLQDTRKRKQRTSRTEEIQLEDATGIRRWYSVTATGIAGEESGAAHDDAGDGVVAVFRDISGQREIRRQHAEFVSAVSHEMKTPLAGIKAYVELLADGDAEDEATREEFLEVINGQADRLQRLIDNLLNLARIEAGVVKVSKESQGLNEILQEALNVVQPSAENKQIELLSELSPMYLGAYVDRDMMLQTAINLLSNAVKYTAPGGRVTLRSRMRDGELQFEVEDTGVGLAPEDFDKVFNKFYRVERNKGMAPGTGLGLPLAKHIVEDVHGGRITLMSKLGVGSTFNVTIPSGARTGQGVGAFH